MPLPQAAPTPPGTIPLTGTAFKEWSLVCDQLASGAQSLILRKGGIAEGRSGFSWKYDTFFLFPTHFHEQEKFLRGGPHVPPGLVDQERPEITIRLRAEISHKCVLTDWDRIAALAPLHAWTEEIIRERFDYTGEQSMSAAFLRVFALETPITFPNLPKYGGCRSWVEIPADPTAPARPVLTDAAHSRRLQEFLQLSGQQTP